MSDPPQHSPGPWTYDGESVWDADNCYVCSRVTPGNGRVIAAAPEMYAALRDVLRIEGEWDTLSKWDDWDIEVIRRERDAVWQRVRDLLKRLETTDE